ncbi:TPA: imidazoleglycerol-phosphate dehydratase, partial [Candidatus Bathyarchaeota archaeon]|nr:imidazoleglycerol-phosphate dehydratase [Candidatus Bathyarchaeota archaeon]
MAKERKAEVERKTKETKVKVYLNLDRSDRL